VRTGFLERDHRHLVDRADPVREGHDLPDEAIAVHVPPQLAFEGGRREAERLRTGEISRSDQHHLLSLARDVEQSVLEAKWNEIVKTTDAEFQVLIRAVVSETIAHKAKIVARLAVTPKRV